MKKFDIIAVRENGTLTEKAVKHGKAPSSSKVLDTVKGHTPNSALKTYRIKAGAGISKTTETLSDEEKQSLEPKNAFFVDFNGVLDDYQESLKKHRERASFLIPKITDPKKIYILCQAALKYNALMVFTSEHRNSGVNLYTVIGRCLSKSSNEEHVEFFNNNRRELRSLSKHSTESFGLRTDEIARFVKENEITHCATFEDDHPIDERFNPIYTQRTKGLDSSHIEKAIGFLSL